MRTYFRCGVCEHEVDVPEPEDVQKFLVKKDFIWSHYKWDHFDLVAEGDGQFQPVVFKPVPPELAPTLIDGGTVYPWSEVQRLWS